MRLWAMLTLCCLVVISVCSMNIDASDRFDAQSISDVLNRAKRQTEIRDDGPTVDGNPDQDERPQMSTAQADAAFKAEEAEFKADFERSRMEAERNPETEEDPDKRLVPSDEEAKNMELALKNAEIEDIQANPEEEKDAEADAVAELVASRSSTFRKIPYYYNYYYYKRQCPCEPECCDTRPLTVDTGYRNPGVTNADGVIGDCLQDPSWWPVQSKTGCYRTALLRFKFDKITRKPCPGLCVNSPMCGRRYLRLEFDLAFYFYRSFYPRFMMHISDSPTNYGWKGDSPNLLRYDANAVGANYFFMVHGNDNCRRIDPYYFTGAITPLVRKLVVEIGHGFIRVTNDRNYDKQLCDPCLWNFNELPDFTYDPFVYVGINRNTHNSLNNPAFNGYGVCKTVATWECPWKDCCDHYPYRYPYYYYAKSNVAGADSARSSAGAPAPAAGAPAPAAGAPP